MIVNLPLNETTKQFIFPKLQLDEDKNWEFSLINFMGVIQEVKSVRRICRLRTNMIDRDASNQNQDIAYVCLERNESLVNIKPTQKLVYKLRFLDFSAAEVNFQEIKKTSNIKFDSAVLQFEINETYGRF